jgi:hypothetical protein
LVFLFFLFAQLAVVGALCFCSIIIAHWLERYRRGEYLTDYSIWCFKNGYAPYIEIACLIVAGTIVGKIAEKHVPLCYILIPLGVLFIFVSIYIVSLGAVMLNLGTPPEFLK